MNRSIFEQILSDIEKSTDKDGNHLELDGLIISDDSTEYSHYYASGKIKNDVRSICKPIINMCIGIEIEKKNSFSGMNFNLDMKIWPFFKDTIKLTEKQNEKYLERLTIRHLITHTMGYSEGLLFRKDVEKIGEKNLLEYAFNYKIEHAPGDFFAYSNVGPYIFSALIQNELGLTLDSWVNDTLFSKIDITEYEWKKYGNYCAGSTGLEISIEDLHKIGKIIHSGGMYGGKQIVPKNWIDEMRRIQVNTPDNCDLNRAFPKKGYGFGLWITPKGQYFCDGTDGQYLIVIPEKSIVISTMGHQKDMKPIGECFRRLIE